ncbi:MAG TPA: hypothetical protein VN679_15320 [Candidatus Acidoferrales bacterium]|nr:hypothetical protein [Candidatus Acidoferrales bacterium]
MGYQVISTRPNDFVGGERVLYQCDNGYQVSTIRNRYSYGGDHGLWELAVINRTGELDYTTSITDDVVGHLTDADVLDYLARVDALPEAPMLALPNPEE